MTEEGEFEQDPKDTADGDPNFVWFRKALITVPAAGVLPFCNVVTATTEEGSTSALKLVNRCAVSQHYAFSLPLARARTSWTWRSGPASFRWAATIRCRSPRFPGPHPSVRPAAVPSATAGPSGSPLTRRWVLAGWCWNCATRMAIPCRRRPAPPTEVTINSFQSQFVFPTLVTSGASCPVPKPGEAPLPCEVRGFYDVVVKRHPDGQRCLVAASRVGPVGPLVGLTLTATHHPQYQQRQQQFCRRRQPVPAR